MAVVGYATIQLIPSLQGFAGQVNKQITPAANNAGRNAGKSSGGLFSGGFIGAVTKIASAAGIYSAISGIASGFSNAIKTGLQGNANLQAYSISFETLLGSAGKAKDMIADLYNFAAKTPFDVEGSVVGAQKLLGVGVAAKDVIPTLTTLGDAVGALGGGTNEFNSVLLAYSQIMARGKVSTQDLYQISNTGIPIFQLLSKALGMPVGEMQKLIETGKLASGDVLPKLLAVMNQDYGGAMTKQAATLGGVFSTFKDEVNQALTTALQPLATFLQGALPGATTAASASIIGIGKAVLAIGGFFKTVFESSTVQAFVQPFVTLGKAIGGALAPLGPTFAAAFGSIGSSLSGVLPLFTPFSTLLSSMLPLVTPLVSLLGGALASAFQIVAQVLEAIAPAGATFQRIITSVGTTLTGALLPVFRQLIPAIQPLLTMFVSLATSVIPPLATALNQIVSVVGGAFLQVFSAIATTVFPLFVSVLQTIIPVVMQVVGAVLPFVTMLVSQLAPVITTLISTLMPPLLSLFQALMPIIQALIPPILSIVSTIAGALLPIFKAIMPVITAVIGAIVPIIQSLATIIAGVVNVIAGLLKGDFSQAWKGAQQIVSGVWGVIKGVVVGAVNIIKAAITAALGIIKAVWNATWQVVGTALKAAWDAAVAVVKTGVDLVLGAVRGIQPKVVGFLAGAGTWLVKSGKALIEGFIKGITAGVQLVKGAVDKVVSAARDFFPFSPAKTGPFSGKGWTLYSGRSLVDGFADGIGDRQSSLRKVMNATFQAPSGLDAVDVGPVTGDGVRGALASAASTTRSGAYIGTVNLTTAKDSNAGVVDELNFYLRNLDRGGR